MPARPPDPLPSLPADVLPEEPGEAPVAEEPTEEEVPLPVLVLPEPEKVAGRFALEEAFPGVSFNRPLDLQHAGDGSGRIFVVEKQGVIFVLPGPGAGVGEMFLDLRSRVDDSGSEMGLLGLAFHPEFSRNGFLYVNYTEASRTVVARFTATGDRADPGSGTTILAYGQPARNHNGGQLAFGPDGYLYIASGDGGGAGDPQGYGQDRKSLLGKILRIDVDRSGPQGNYAIPPDNPFVGNGEGFREEIHAYGLRNPWRFSFDYPTGRLWAADVGQNRMEEINLIQSGGNYGWNIMEGTLCHNPSTGCNPEGLELPVFEYGHSLGRSITGGHVYRGSSLPTLGGAYVYGDYVSGRIWGLWYLDRETMANHLLVETGRNIASFGVDEAGELYVAAFDGRIYRLAAR
ncbi:PQQ-dependent sugar dehydrogenase [Clostridiales bacterium F-3ap]|uniref:PQQ-dependent sugar dehydrogenase n=2 Tax=Anaerotalea alkaliphila TaxID=2662126 RepID=A0A7X5HVL0_9FIRM|nr:PQQ-dependent sugar dehydrogenase [Anaerotalea alkaliphila]